MATSIVETITPQKAQEYLAKSGGNRNISKPVVRSYANSMKEGKWLLNGEPIVFDVDGVLLNGHHRLNAVIEANVPIQTFVTRGVEHESFSTFDCGRNRTLGQLIGMQGVKNYNVISSAVQVCYRLENGANLGDNGFFARFGLPNSKLIDMYNNNKELYDEAGNYAQHCRTQASFFPQSVTAGSYAYLCKIGYSKDTIKAFFDDLCQLDTSKNQTINLLRKRLINEHTKQGARIRREFVFALVIKTWNCYIQGITLKCLKYDPEKEEYPKFLKRDEVGKED